MMGAFGRAPWPGTCVIAGHSILQQVQEVILMLYIDPGVGSIVLQVVFAALLGAAITTRRWWDTVSRRVRSLIRRGQ
jgi:hypothetical protein